MTARQVRPALSDYENVRVVDAGGNGDFTLLSDAVASVTAPTTIKVFGSITETAHVVCKDTVDIVFNRGAIVNLGASYRITMDSDSVVATFYNGNILSANTDETILLSDAQSIKLVDTEINLSGIGGVIINKPDTGASSLTCIRSRLISTATNSVGINLDDELGHFELRDTYINTRSYAVLSPASEPADTLWINCDFYSHTSGFSVFVGSLGDNNVFGCRFYDSTEGFYPVNNYSNVVNGATYPAIP